MRGGRQEGRVHAAGVGHHDAAERAQPIFERVQLQLRLLESQVLKSRRAGLRERHGPDYSETRAHVAESLSALFQSLQFFAKRHSSRRSAFGPVESSISL